MCTTPVAARLLTLVATFLVVGCAGGSDGSRTGGPDSSASGETDSAAASNETDSAAAASDGSAPGSGGPAADGGASSNLCAPGGFRDDFSGAAIDASTWRQIGFMGWTPEIVDGRLTFTPNSGYANTRAGLVRSSTPFSLTGCSTWLEVSRALPTDIPGEITVALNAQNGANVGFIRVRQGSLYFAVNVDGAAEMASIPFDATAHRWWRFREAEGVLYLETSPDARTWSVQLERTHGADVSAVQLGINVIETSITGVFEAPQFDNVNVTP